MNVYMTPKKLLQKVVLKEPHPKHFPKEVSQIKIVTVREFLKEIERQRDTST
jgi:hypothetical protein